MLKKALLPIVLLIAVFSAIPVYAQEATEEPTGPSFTYTINEDGSLEITFGENVRIVESHLYENLGEIQFQQQEGNILLMAGPKGWFYLMLGEAPFFDVRYSSSIYTAGYSGKNVSAWKVSPTESGFRVDLVFWSEGREAANISFASHEYKFPTENGGHFGPYAVNGDISMPTAPEEWALIAAWGVENPLQDWQQ
ncbi:MAG: hypothetical protein JNK26_04790 [Candidatus Doudnabacteria bacterium]|nr:hypothetical protein [Candidatus Doudnabacteria bacterium]